MKVHTGGCQNMVYCDILYLRNQQKVQEKRVQMHSQVQQASQPRMPLLVVPKNIMTIREAT